MSEAVTEAATLATDAPAATTSVTTAAAVTEPETETQPDTARAQLDAALARIATLEGDMNTMQSERDTARSERAALQRETREANIRTAALRLGFADADDALRFVPTDASDVEQAVKEVLAGKPYLARAAAKPVVTSPTNPARAANATGTFTRAQIADRSFYVANRDAIMLAMKEGKISD